MGTIFYHGKGNGALTTQYFDVQHSLRVMHTWYEGRRWKTSRALFLVKTIDDMCDVIINNAKPRHPFLRLKSPSTSVAAVMATVPR
jgi:hypothetical protein